MLITVIEQLSVNADCPILFAVCRGGSGCPEQAVQNSRQGANIAIVKTVSTFLAIANFSLRHFICSIAIITQKPNRSY